MKRINLEITALSALAIGRYKPGGSVSEADSYIPGSVIRGAIAAVILKWANTSISDGDNFHELFLGENPAIFQNAYPANSKIQSEVICNLAAHQLKIAQQAKAEDVKQLNLKQDWTNSLINHLRDNIPTSSTTKATQNS